MHEDRSHYLRVFPLYFGQERRDLLNLADACVPVEEQLAPVCRHRACDVSVVCVQLWCFYASCLLGLSPGAFLGPSTGVASRRDETDRSPRAPNRSEDGRRLHDNGSEYLHEWAAPVCEEGLAAFSLLNRYSTRGSRVRYLEKYERSLGEKKTKNNSNKK